MICVSVRLPCLYGGKVRPLVKVVEFPAIPSVGTVFIGVFPIGRRTVSEIQYFDCGDDSGYSIELSPLIEVEEAETLTDLRSDWWHLGDEDTSSGVH
jgi:hypothetical protein